MKLKAKIFKADVSNANGIVYTKDALEKAILEYNKKDRYALGGKYPPEVNLNDLPVEKFIGEAKLEFDGEYVIASIEALNYKTTAITDAVYDCPEKIKVMPVSQGIIEPSHVVNNLSIIHIICTCDDVTIGDVDKDMFIAEIIEDENNTD